MYVFFFTSWSNLYPTTISIQSDDFNSCYAIFDLNAENVCKFAFLFLFSQSISSFPPPILGIQKRSGGDTSERIFLLSHANCFFFFSLQSSQMNIRLLIAILIVLLPGK